MERVKIIFFCFAVYYQTSVIFGNEIGQQKVYTEEFIEHSQYKTKEHQQNLDNTRKNDNLQQKVYVKKYVNIPKKVTDLYGFGLIQNRASKDGIIKIKSAAYLIQQRVDPDLDVNDIVNNSTKRYYHDVTKYFNTIREKKFKYDIDVDFYYLDTVQFVNELFKRECNYLLDDIIAHANSNLTYENLSTLEEAVAFNVINEKQDTLIFMCEHVNICRPYPAFLDYIAELISDILKLMDKKHLFEFVKAVEVVAGNKIHFYRTLMSDEIAYEIQTTLKALITDVGKITEFFSMASNTLAERYRLFTTAEIGVDEKTKAFKILLDIIDKMFDGFGNEVLSTEFENLHFIISEWAAGVKHNIHKVLATFVNNFMEVISNNLEEETGDEVKVLLEIIITGNSSNHLLYNNLINRGSKFVNFDGILDNLIIG